VRIELIPVRLGFASWQRVRGVDRDRRILARGRPARGDASRATRSGRRGDDLRRPGPGFAYNPGHDAP